MRHVGILIFDGVEVLDACGPFEVFATAKDIEGNELFQVSLIAEKSGPVTAVGGMLLQPNHTLTSAPAIDVLIVPGGVGRKREMVNPVVLDWVRERAAKAEMVLSVCTGAFILAAVDLLDSLTVTTHFSAHDELEQSHPQVTLRRGARFVDNGRIITAAGIAAGIDASIHAVARLAGADCATRVAARMEYRPTS